MITAFDVQFAVGASRPTIPLSPLAADLVANLLNDFIYEFRGQEVSAVVDRHHRALDFVYKELANVLTDASRELRVERAVTAVDILHWISPRWPDLLKKQGSVLGFVFDKE
jgi:hypothetical protein